MTLSNLPYILDLTHFTKLGAPVHKQVNSAPFSV